MTQALGPPINWPPSQIQPKILVSRGLKAASSPVHAWRKVNRPNWAIGQLILAVLATFRPRLRANLEETSCSLVPVSTWPFQCHFCSQTCPRSQDLTHCGQATLCSNGAFCLLVRHPDYAPAVTSSVNLETDGNWGIARVSDLRGGRGREYISHSGVHTVILPVNHERG